MYFDSAFILFKSRIPGRAETLKDQLAKKYPNVEADIAGQYIPNFRNRDQTQPLKQKVELKGSKHDVDLCKDYIKSKVAKWKIKQSSALSEVPAAQKEHACKFLF